MIKRHDEVLSEYTNERLLADSERSDGQRAMARSLLQAPPRVPAGHRGPRPRVDHDD